MAYSSAWCRWCSILKLALAVLLWDFHAEASGDAKEILNLLRSEVWTPNPKCGDRVVVGVDYYPEQWPYADLQADMHAIKDDLGANLIRIGEFMWHEIEPKDGQFNFTLLDAILEVAEGVGLEVMLGTPTATMPAWLYKKHPEVATQLPDSPEGTVGARAGFGGRRQYSFTSKEYLRHVERMVTKLAERYGQRKSITFWQVDNEIGHEGSDLDFSEDSKPAWHSWLQDRFKGDISSLNDAWGTVFWGVTYNDFDEIPLPRFTIPGGVLSIGENFRSNHNPGMLLDFRRFRRSAISSFTNRQIAILREQDVIGCVTTNAPGGFWGKALDHNDLFAKMDFPAYDNYPVWGGSIEPNTPSQVGLSLDTVRGWGLIQHGRSGWMVAEQLIGAQGHDIIGFTPRPGQAKAWAAASFLHGAFGLNFFRYRAAVFGQEQFCYGILDHTTPRGKGRKWMEAKSLYGLAREYSDIWLAPIESEVAVLYDSDNIFAWQAQPQSNTFNFENEVHRLYYPFWRNGAAVDVISSRHIIGDAKKEAWLKSKYRVLVLPAPMLVSDALLPVVEDFAKNGGSVWVGFRSDLKNEDGQLRRIPSRLANLAGVEIAEIESLNNPMRTTLESTDTRFSSATAQASVWREGLQIIQGSSEHSQAKAKWKYTDSFFGKQGYAAVTQRELNGSAGGEIVYVGTGIDEEALVAMATDSLKRQGVRTAGIGATPNVEQVLRKDKSGKLWHVEINHGEESVQSTLNSAIQLSPFEIHIGEVSHEKATPQKLRFV